jgi:hypothetical protein
MGDDEQSTDCYIIPRLMVAIMVYITNTVENPIINL